MHSPRSHTDDHLTMQYGLVALAGVFLGTVSVIAAVILFKNNGFWFAHLISLTLVLLPVCGFIYWVYLPKFLNDSIQKIKGLDSIRAPKEFDQSSFDLTDARIYLKTKSDLDSEEIRLNKLQALRKIRRFDVFSTALFSVMSMEVVLI